MKLIKKFKEQPKSKQIAMALILAGIIFMVFLNPKDQKFFEQAEREIRLAMSVCENVDERYFNNVEKLKIDNSEVTDIMIHGKVPSFKYVKNPRILYFKQGFQHTQKEDELVCSFKDPRDGEALYYSYKTHTWDRHTRTRF